MVVLFRFHDLNVVYHPSWQGVPSNGLFDGKAPTSGHNKSSNMWVATGIEGRDLGMRSANERRRYIVMTSLIGWAHTSTDPQEANVKHIF